MEKEVTDVIRKKNATGV